MQADKSRGDLLAAVEARRVEVDGAILARVRTIGTPGEETGADTDIEYLEGVRLAVEAAIDHTLEASAAADDRPLPVPAPIVAQARLAARRRTPLETVLRRYLAGHAVLGDYLAEEAERQDISPAVLRTVLRSQAVATDRAVAAISAIYLEETASARPPTARGMQAERVRRLLAGELLDPSVLGYDLGRWHVGLVSRGPESDEAFVSLAIELDAMRLIVPADDGRLWVWLGFRQRPDPRRTDEALSASLPEGSAIGIGEPGLGRAGWRLTHDQAQAALTVALRGPARGARYADIASLASALRDELFCVSLRSLYLEPLGEGDDGLVLRETLRAYLDAERNVTSAAAALGVSRNTVTNRLRAIESRIGHLHPSRVGELALVLQLERLELQDRQTGPTELEHSDKGGRRVKHP